MKSTLALGLYAIGSVMAVHIFEANHPHQSITRLHCLAGYEDGSVCLYVRDGDEGTKTVEGRGWIQLWRMKEHTESGWCIRRRSSEAY